MRRRWAAGISILAVTGIAGCASATHASAPAGTSAARPAADHGRLIPAVSCWIADNYTEGGGTDAVIAVTSPGGKVDCASVIGEISTRLPSGIHAVRTSPLPPSAMTPAEVACSGTFAGYQVTAVTVTGTTTDPALSTCTALGFPY
jgi:hypothetical protein